MYYDRRSDPRDRRNEISLQSSFDHGKTFTPRVTLSDRSFDSRIGFGWERGMPDIGSRLASLSTDARVFAVWTDTRAGTQITRKQDQMRAVAAFSSPARLDGWEKWALRVGAFCSRWPGWRSWLGNGLCRSNRSKRSVRICAPRRRVIGNHGPVRRQLAHRRLQRRGAWPQLVSVSVNAIVRRGSGR